MSSIIALGRSTVSALAIIYKTYSADNTARLDIVLKGSEWVSNSGNVRIPVDKYLNVDREFSGNMVNRILLDPSLQAPPSNEMYLYNMLACMKPDGTLLVGHPFIGKKKVARGGMPPFEDLFCAPSLTGVVEVMSDILMNDVLCGADVALKGTASVGGYSMYGLEMEDGSPVLTGYSGIPGRSSNWVYPYKTGIPLHDGYIEKLVGLSDRFTSCFSEVELSAMYWFKCITGNTSYKARVSYNKYHNEYTMLVY